MVVIVVGFRTLKRYVHWEYVCVCVLDWCSKYIGAVLKGVCYNMIHVLVPAMHYWPHCWPNGNSILKNRA
jgi:hypothetical protein